MTDYLLSTEDGNTLTTEGEVELLLFESSASLAYRLNVDWDGDGVVDEDSEAYWMMHYAIDRGRDTIIEPSGGGFTPQEIGKLYLTLDNSDGRYDPWNTDSPLYPNVKPGKLIKFKVNVITTTDYAGQDLFTGYISDIQVNGRRDTVNIVAEDTWRLFSEGKYFKRTHRPIYAYSYVNGLLSSLGYPYATTVSTDDCTPGFSRYAWCDNLSYEREIENVTNATLGRAYITGDGVFHYKALTTTDAVELTITNDEVLKDIYLPTPWGNTRDKIVLKAIDIQTGVPVNNTKGILSNNTPILVNGGATEERWINYSLTSTDELANGSVYGLWEKFAFSANAAKSGTDTDMTSDFSVTPNYYNLKVGLSITNNSSDDGYLYNYKVYGATTDGSYTTSDDAFSGDRNCQFLYITEYDKEFTDTSDSVNSFVLESPHLSVGKALDNAYASYFDASTDPILVGTQGDIDRLNDVGNTLLNYLKTPKVYPTIQMQGRYPDQIQLDIEDTVQLTLTALGIDDTYRVHKVSHEAEGNCQDVLSTFKLYPIMSRST